MDWLKDYDDRMREVTEGGVTNEQNEMRVSLLTSSSNPIVVDSLINTDAINVCNNDDFIASDREGIG
jgi:hypothetical protein